MAPCRNRCNVTPAIVLYFQVLTTFKKLSKERIDNYYDHRRDMNPENTSFNQVPFLHDRPTLKSMQSLIFNGIAF